VRLFPDVASLPMRPPAMIAKAAASLDVMSGGRFELGLGAGAFWDAVAGMGGTVRERGERLPALEEAIHVIRAALDVGTERGVVRSDGPYYPLRYPAGPPTPHRVEIWIGAMKSGALRAIGRLADGWIPGGGVSRIDEFPELTAHIDGAAEAAGRDPRSIRRIVNINGAITDGPSPDPRAGTLVGPQSLWIETLVRWAEELGVDGFVFWPPDNGTDQVRRFGTDVAPLIRERLKGVS
jgi:alkanesulfonate monooxygenase SsuD/methylene tetrahydromethanopterin reductase-like flavin-dependent oxidoreductase (luciferase family)